MSDVKNIEAHDVGGDVLRVTGTIDGVFVKDPDTGEDTDRLQTITAHGWVSALENHYPADAYDDDGLKLKTTKKGAPGDPEHEPRPMTKAERRAYCEQLLLGASPKPAVEPTPVDLG